MKSIVIIFGLAIICSCTNSDDELRRVIVYGDDIAAIILKENGKYGLTDTLGNIIVPPKYDFIEDFHEFGVVRTDSGGYDASGFDYVYYQMNKIGLIDIRGRKILFEPQFNQLSFSSNGLALVEKDGKHGFINNKGEYVINLQYEDALPFMNNFAVVKKDGKYGLIDTANQFIVEPTYDTLELNWIGKGRDTMLLNLNFREFKFIDKTGNIFKIDK